MKSDQALKMNIFNRATRDKFSIMLNIIILISQPVSDKFHNVLKKVKLFQELRYALSSI